MVGKVLDQVVPNPRDLALVFGLGKTKRKTCGDLGFRQRNTYLKSLQYISPISTVCPCFCPQILSNIYTNSLNKAYFLDSPDSQKKA